MLRSEMCKQGQLESDVFQGWGARLGERPGHMHRKVWEYCYISQALYEREMLGPGARGLGFAVGQEPLAALFASLGSYVVATDLATADADAAHWAASGMHADSLEALNARGICEPEVFQRRARFRFLDMRALPRVTELGTFDFLWSACSFEHLGTLEAGERFVYESLRYLRPGGLAVHTTEFNVSSDDATLADGPVCLYRRQDLERMAAELVARGYRVAELDFTDGDLPGDHVVAQPPFAADMPHLKLNLGGFTATSFGLIVERLAGG